MAGSGVSVGGTAMLRTRRRDVSIKPNRRLDRKSSRGMIYENEELRLRTININAEVEQGQNDIKKLRRENEQLRREIWSLRDEYDKLEELVKNQSSHGSSDELEGRSGEEDNIDDSYIEYSGDEDVEEEQEEEDEGEEVVPDDGKSQEEDLENAENQKISSEKMNSSLHRLHVEFDDLSVVDEEEELKKDKDKKDSVVISNGNQLPRETDPLLMDQNNQETVNVQSQDNGNFRYYPSSYDMQLGALTASERKYFNECPFVFPNSSDLNYPKMLMSPCSKIYNGQLTPIPSLDTPALGPVDPIFGHPEPPRVHVPPNYPLGNPGMQIPTKSGFRDNLNPSIFDTQNENTSFNGYVNNLPISKVPNLPQRRDIRFKQPVNFFKDTFYKNSSTETPNSGESVGQNGWDFSFGRDINGGIPGGRIRAGDAVHFETGDKGTPDSSVSPMPDKPKHFFAPLPSKLWVQRSLDDVPLPSMTSRTLDTATSSSSDKTSSTVVSRNHLARKGPADVYVNGGYPVGSNMEEQRSANTQSTFLTSEDFLIEEAANISRQSSNNPLVKSLSCQDLSSDPQNLPFSEKLKLFNDENCTQKLITKSDNTLDSIPNSSRPYKSQLNVTLKLPKPRIPSSPDTPEIPKLPTINYRLFNNPFLQSFDQERKNYTNFNVECPMTRPLSIQVNENALHGSLNNNNLNLNYSSPMLLQQSNQNIENNYFHRLRSENQIENDSRLLLMAPNQFRNVEENTSSVINAPQSSLRGPPLGFEVTSFEGPKPQTLLQPQINPLMFPGNLGTLGISPTQMAPRIMYENKVPAQTQTSIDGDLQIEETKTTAQDNQSPSGPGSSPLTLRRKRTLRKDRPGSMKDKRPLSPAAQRRKERLRKQSSSVPSSEPPDSPAKTPQRTRKLSVTTSTSADVQDKNESRSSSSGQDSPKKIEQRRRVSLYFNSKKRPSLVTTKIDRRSSADGGKEGRYSIRRDVHDATTTNSERERTNSVSSRDTVTKGRKLSTGSGKVPWCACWGNGCV